VKEGHILAIAWALGCQLCDLMPEIDLKGERPTLPKKGQVCGCDQIIAPITPARPLLQDLPA
jgi:hypothetical protein